LGEALEEPFLTIALNEAGRKAYNRIGGTGVNNLKGKNRNGSGSQISDTSKEAYPNPGKRISRRKLLASIGMTGAAVISGGVISSLGNSTYASGVQPATAGSKSALAALDPNVYGTATLTATGQEGDFVAVSENLSSLVSADPMQGVYIPFASDPTGATGAWVRVHNGTLRAEWFGPLNDPDTNHTVIQAAIDLSPLVKAKVTIPDRQVETRNPIHTVDYLDLSGEGRNSEIFNTYTGANNAKRICICIGQGQPAYLATNANGGKKVRYTWHAGGAVTHNSYSLTLSNPADAQKYAIGDKVYARSLAYYRGGGNSEQAHFGQANIVMSSSPATGVVTFKYPLLGEWADSLLCNMTQEVVIDTITVKGDVWTGRQVSPAVGVNIHNLRLRCDELSGHGFARTAMLDCDVDVHIWAAEGLWFNGACFSRMRAVWHGWDKACELAMQCTGSTYKIYANYDKRAGASTQPMVKIGECSNYNTIDLEVRGNFDVPGSGVIDFDNGVSNVVNVYAMDVPAHTGDIINVTSRARDASKDTGETTEPNWRNTVNMLCTVTCAPSNYVRITNPGGMLEDFTMNGGVFTGTPSKTALALAGARTSIIGGRFGPGRINTSGATDLRLVLAGGPFTYSALGHLLEWSVNGVQQCAAGTLVTHAGGSLAINMGSPRQTINVTGADVTFISPILAGAQYGTTVHVTLTNRSGGPFVPAFGTDWHLNGWTVPELGPEMSIMFTVIRPPMASGITGTPVLVMNPTPPF
jgi:hypothetical protein